MGLLDQVIGNVLGQVMGGGQGGQGGRSGGEGQGGASGGLGGALSSPIVQALLMLLLQKGAGGLGDMFGGGRQAPQGGRDGSEAFQPYGRDEGDIGGFGQDRGGQDDGRAGRQPQREGDFGDLSGMLDGPGGSSGGRAQPERAQSSGPGGLDGLIDRFQQGGLGDVMDSWIGPGQNRQVAPSQLGDALGSDTVDGLQKSTGLGRDDLLSQLAKALPGVIDGLTPHGRRPSAEDARGW